MYIRITFAFLSMIVATYVFAMKIEPSVQQKATMNGLTCTVITTHTNREYSVSTKHISKLEKNTVLRCFSKALNAKSIPSKEAEITVSARIYARVPGLDCFQADEFILKFSNEIPDDLEIRAAACYRKAYELRKNKE